MNPLKMKKIRINNPKNIFVFYVIISLVISYFFVWLQIGKIHSESEQLIKNKELIRYNSDTKNDSSLINKRLKELEPQINKLDAAYINRNQVIEFITTLEGMEKDNSLEVVEKNILPPEGSKKDDLKTNFSLSVRGSLDDVLAYLIDFYDMSYIMNIDSIQVSDQPISINEDVLVTGSRSTKGRDFPVVEKKYLLKISGNLYWR